MYWRWAHCHALLSCSKHSSWSRSHQGGFTLWKMLSCLLTGSAALAQISEADSRSLLIFHALLDCKVYLPKSYQKYVVGLAGKRGYSRSKGDSKRGSSSPESQLCAALQSQLPVLSLQTEFFSRYFVSHWASAGPWVPYCPVVLSPFFFPCTHPASGFYLGVQPTPYSSTLPVAAWSGVQLWACPSDSATGSTCCSAFSTGTSVPGCLGWRKDVTRAAGFWPVEGRLPHSGEQKFVAA